MANAGSGDGTRTTQDENHEISMMPQLPDGFESGGEFRALLLKSARVSLEDIAAATQLDLPSAMDWVAKAVLQAHMVRLYKLLDAYLALLETDRRDAAVGLCRTMMEILINIDYLFAADDLPRRSRAFIAQSVERLLSPISYLYQQVHHPENPDNEEDLGLFFASIRPIVDLRVDAAGMLSRAGLITEANDLADFRRQPQWKTLLEEWPRHVQERATSDVAKRILNTEFAQYSLAIHPNWRDMELRDLTYSEGSEELEPCLESLCPENDEILLPFGWCVAAAARYAGSVDIDEGQTLHRRLARTIEYIQGAKELWDREFERQCGEVDDGEPTSPDNG